MSIHTLLIAASLAAAAAAQCPFSSLTATTYGQGCITVFGTPPTQRSSLDGTQCTLGVTVDAFTGCCNTFLTGRVLVLGLQQANVPVPQIGQGCTLLVDPIAFLFQTPPAGDTFTLPLPPFLVPPLQLQSQGASIYRTFGVEIDAQLTAGQAILLQ
jgi:hypothetical protein